MPITDPNNFPVSYDYPPYPPDIHLKCHEGSLATAIATRGLWLKTDGCLERVNTSRFDMGVRVPAAASAGSISTPGSSITRLSPFTPCMTPSPSVGSASSVTSSPSLHSTFDLPSLLSTSTNAEGNLSSCISIPLNNNFNNTTNHINDGRSRRASIDSGTSRASSQRRSAFSPAVSPASYQHQAQLFIPAPTLIPPLGLACVYAHHEQREQHEVTAISEAPPKKRTRRSPRPETTAVTPTRTQSSLPLHSDFSASTTSSCPAVVAIPPAQAADLPFDPTAAKRHAAGNSRRGANPAKAKRSPRSGSASASSVRPSTRRRGKADNGASEPQQPVKFRFVSVLQHAAPRSRRVRGRDSRSGGVSGGAPDASNDNKAGVGADADADPNAPEFDEEDDDEEDDGHVYFEEHMEEDVDDVPFEHGPTDLPPRAYPGGEYATSPLRPKKPVGKIPASNLEFLPVLEARFVRLERAIEKYVALRAEQALQNSLLPSSGSIPASTVLPGTSLAQGHLHIQH